MNAERTPKDGDENDSDWIHRWAEVGPKMYKAVAINKRTGKVWPPGVLLPTEEDTTQKDTADEQNPLTLNTIAGRLSVNPNDGAVALGTQKGNLHPDSKEMKLLLCCICAGGQLVKYSVMAPSGVTIIWKIELTQSLKNIKTALGILPKRSGANKDIFTNIRNIGYRIDVPPEN